MLAGIKRRDPKATMKAVEVRSGAFYRLMMSEVANTLKDLKEVPGLRRQRLLVQLPAPRLERRPLERYGGAYEENLVCLIRTFAAWKAPIHRWSP